jgi:tRNA splicing endonuclease
MSPLHLDVLPNLEAFCALTLPFALASETAEGQWQSSSSRQNRHTWGKSAGKIELLEANDIITKNWIQFRAIILQKSKMENSRKRGASRCQVNLQ